MSKGKIFSSKLIEKATFNKRWWMYLVFPFLEKNVEFSNGWRLTYVEFRGVIYVINNKFSLKYRKSCPFCYPLPDYDCVLTTNNWEDNEIGINKSPEYLKGLEKLPEQKRQRLIEGDPTFI